MSRPICKSIASIAVAVAVICEARLGTATLSAQDKGRALVTVVLDPSLGVVPVSGRLLLLVSSESKPLDSITPAAFGLEAEHQWIAAQEVAAWRPGEAVQIDIDEIAWPKPLSIAPDSEYQVMALLDVDRNAGYIALSPNDLRSRVIKTRNLRAVRELRLEQRVPAPPENYPEGQEPIDFVSPSLSAFWGRPITMRGIVVLPPGYRTNSERYPTIFFLHGYGANVATMRNGRARRSAEGMRDGDLPPMIWVLLDQSLPSGTHEFVDSVNNGPWGHALTLELIPYIEKKYRMDSPAGRFLNGHSSGGWAALWLQIRYHELFGGTWATSPDSVDFRNFNNLDLYADRNAYMRPEGSSTPLIREDGRITQTLESAARQEVVVGEYGGQQSSFEWVFSPRAADGRPAPLFDRATGGISRDVAEHWRQHYDIAQILGTQAAQLVPKLRRKIHVAVGTADQFHLDQPVRLLEERIKSLGYDATFTYLDGWTHFALIRDGKEVDRFGTGVMVRIASQMFARARPKAKWSPKTVPHPASTLKN